MVEQTDIPRPSDALSQDEGIHLVANRIQGLLECIEVETLKV